jgi:DNA-binding MarR family transcriptional regulator
VPDLDTTIHQRTRLAILSALHRNREARFTDLQEALDLTAGNLTSHADTLEEAGYLESFEALAGTEFETRYRITDEGAAAFEAYLEDLERLLADPGVPDPEPADAEGRPEADPGPSL